MLNLVYSGLTASADYVQGRVALLWRAALTSKIASYYFKDMA